MAKKATAPAPEAVPAALPAALTNASELIRAAAKALNMTLADKDNAMIIEWVNDHRPGFQWGDNKAAKINGALKVKGDGTPRQPRQTRQTSTRPAPAPPVDLTADTLALVMREFGSDFKKAKKAIEAIKENALSEFIEQAGGAGAALTEIEKAEAFISAKKKLTE